MTTIKIAIAQLNYTVGDIYGNMRKILDVREKMEDVDLIVFSELCITGYPPEDLVLNEAFQQESVNAAKDLAKITSDNKAAMLIGTPWVDDGKLYNAAILLSDGEMQIQFKYDLPNYGVFDEKRVFSSGKPPTPMLFKGMNLGIMICEDMWNGKVAEALKDAELLISINASPFEIGKHKKRIERSKAAAYSRPLIYVNQICGQDDLVFDGDSFVLCGNDVPVSLSRTSEAIEITEWNNLICKRGTIRKHQSQEEVIYNAMVLGLKDYVEKNGFHGVLIGMSGGIDSALTAAIAVDALGKENVRLIMMPSRYTSKDSLDDAKECSDALGVNLETIPIENMFEDFENILLPSFSGKKVDLTEENIQSRIRGTILMALSNKFGNMVVATGNKSEMSVGYATLYGDMCGGYSVLKDVYKTQVYALSNWRNTNNNVIPQNIITKAPTAELRHDQKDEDSLPPYDILDTILEGIIEKELSLEKIIASGFEENTVKQIFKMLHKAEYKRRQSPLGVKISVKPFSRDRRYPITNYFL